MHAQLVDGIRVETVKPEKDRNWLVKWRSNSQRDEAWKRMQPQWSALGRIVKRLDAANLFGEGLPALYEVEHEDKTRSLYEASELRPCCEHEDYTPAERQAMLARMDAVIDEFYKSAARAGCHTLIEFTGLMGEYLNACKMAHERGEQFAFASAHSGSALPFQPYQLAYLAEKLNCIYGPALRSEAHRKAFVDALFHGEWKLTPAR